MNEQQVTIFRLLGGAAVALMLDAALHYQLFTSISKGINTLTALSKSTDTDERALSFLLDVLYGFGFLERQDGKYLLTQVSESCLVEGNPHYIGDFRHIANCANEGLKRLHETIKAGGSRVGFEWENKPKGLVLIVEPLAQFLPERITAGQNILIYGPGAGVFAYYLVSSNPKLNITCVDLPSCNRVSKAYFAERQCDVTNIRFVDKDFLNGPLWQCPEGTYEVIILSNVLHFTDETGQKTLLGQVQTLLSKKGGIFVTDFFINRERTRPRFPLLFRLYLLACSEKGEVPCAETLTPYLEEQGLTVSFYDSIPNTYDGSGILAGRS